MNSLHLKSAKCLHMRIDFGNISQNPFHQLIFNNCQASTDYRKNLEYYPNLDHQNIAVTTQYSQGRQLLLVFYQYQFAYVHYSQLYAYHFIIFPQSNSTKFMRREIKKSIILQKNKQQVSNLQRERSRDQHKQQKIREAQIQEVNANKRRQLLRRMRERQQQEEQQFNNDIEKLKTQNQQPESTTNQITNTQQYSFVNTQKQCTQNQNDNKKSLKPPIQLKQELFQEQSQSQKQEQQAILHKPIYVSKQERQTLRNQDAIQQKIAEQYSKKIKIGRLNTKLLMNQTLKAEGQQEDEQQQDSDLQNVEMPDDDDTKDQALEYQYWKIRQLKRIRRDREERNKFAILQADVERRRKMTDQQRLAENKRLGSDITDNTQTTKYVYMQKYYHRGAFFQDSEDSVLKRDYNLPTAMQLQDKTMLPKILQKRKNDFGRKGQSKHTHLVDVDTTNFDPKTKANESVMISLQKKMAGYKDTFFQKKK